METRIRSRAYASGSTLNRKCIYMPHAPKIFTVMHLQLAFVSALRLWPGSHTFKANALAIAPQGSIITQVNRSTSLSTPGFALPQTPLNHTLAPLQNFFTFHVPNSPTTLEIHSLGVRIPVDQCLQTAVLASSIVYEFIHDGKGKRLIQHGFFEYTHDFVNQDRVRITVGDFRELGRSITYRILCDVMRGIGGFALLQKDKMQEMQYEVEVKGMGYTGTGHLYYTPAADPRPTATIA